MTNAPEAADEFLDLESCVRPVAQQYGREMFALVMNAGLCSEAVKVLAAAAQKHQSRNSMHAIGVLSSAFNQVSTALCKQHGWTEEMLAQCDRDIARAWAGRVVLAGAGTSLVDQ